MRTMAMFQAGAMLLAGLGGWAGQAFSQGPMSPGGAAIAPPPRVAPPPPPTVAPVAPTVAPVTPVIPSAPTPRAPSAVAPTTPVLPTPSPTAPGQTRSASGSTSSVQPSGGTNPTSTAIFDRWGNLFTDTPKLQPVSGVGLNAIGPGQSLNTSTDARGSFTLPDLAEGVHQLQLDVGGLDALRGTATGSPTSGRPAELRGGFIIPLIALVAIAVPGEGGNQSIGFAREIPRGTKTLQVKVSVDRNGNTKAVDLGDGAGLVDVSRGKVLPSTNRGSALVGRVGLLQDENSVAPPSVPQATVTAAPAGEKRSTPSPTPTPAANEDIRLSDHTKITYFAKAPGVGVNWLGPSAPRQAVSDANGVVTLGPLSEGVHELTVNTRSAGAGAGGNPASPQILVALLLPAVQRAREGRVFTQRLPAGSDLHLKIGVGQGGKVTSLDWGNGVRVAVGDVNGDGTPDLKVFEDLAKRSSNEVRLAFAGGWIGGSAPQSLPEGKRLHKPAVFSKHADSVGGLGDVSATWTGPAGQGRAVSDGNGGLLLGRNLPQGSYDVSFEFPRSAGGSQPGQQRVLIGLLLPAVQAVRGVEVPLTPGLRGRAKLDVGAGGALRTVTWTWTDGGITASDDWEARGLAVAPAGDGETKLVFSIITGAGPGGGPARDRNTGGGLVPLTDGHAMLPNVGVNSTGPDGVRQLHTDNQGFAPFGKLPVGDTLVDFNSLDLTSALRTAVGPNNPKPQETLIELLVVIAILSLKTEDGEPQVFLGAWPANALPKTLRANLRVGSRDRNVMAVNFGKASLAPQSLTKAGPGTLQLSSGDAYTGNTTVNQGVLKTLQDVARTGKAGDSGVFLFAYDPGFRGGVR